MYKHTSRKKLQLYSTLLAIMPIKPRRRGTEQIEIMSKRHHKSTRRLVKSDSQGFRHDSTPGAEINKHAMCGSKSVSLIWCISNPPTKSCDFNGRRTVSSKSGPFVSFQSLHTRTLKWPYESGRGYWIVYSVLRRAIHLHSPRRDISHPEGQEYHYIRSIVTRLALTQ